jgi:osmoprotectant transport system substrate-binding protein
VNLTRARAIALAGSALALPQCGKSNAIRIGSKNFSESITVGEIFAAGLEQRGFAIDRHMNLGSSQIAMAAIQRGDIQIYPEYTGTALIDVLHLHPIRDAKELYNVVKREYQKRFGLAVLKPSPGSNSQALAVTEAVAKKYNVRTLSQCAQAAPSLRLAAVPEFVARADALPGLQKYYGGFTFKGVRTFDIGLQYEALARGDADVATAFSTDPQIVAQRLVVLEDDRHFWPPYNIVAIVRPEILNLKKGVVIITLDRVTSMLTDTALRRLNYEVDIKKRDPGDVASEFVY